MTQKQYPDLSLLIMEDSKEEIANLNEIGSFVRLAGGDNPNAVGLKRVRIVETIDKALTELDTGRYNGVISDVFVPSGREDDRALRRDLYAMLKPIVREDNYLVLEEMDKWYICAHLYPNKLAPLGIYLAQAAREKQIPVVFCSSESLHGHALEPVDCWGMRNHVEFALPYGMPGKNWDLAYKHVVSGLTGVNITEPDGNLLQMVVSSYATRERALEHHTDILEHTKQVLDIRRHYGIHR